MTTPHLPAVIERFVDAINRGDTDAFLAFFPADGIVEDWGRRFVGREAIRGWSDAELIGAKGQMTVTAVQEATSHHVRMRADWKSQAFTGPGTFTFTLDGDAIREMRISE